jgi:signal transduction histidine kinase
MERFLELVDAAMDVGRDQHRRRLEHAVRITMLAKLCHDLRSNLHVIHGYADMLGDEPPAPAPARGALAGLRKASRQSCEQLDTYAALAHCESERMELRREMVDVRAAVAALRRHVAIRARYSPCALLADAPPRLAVETDPEKLHAMLTHLIDAAIKRSDDGTVGLRVATLADQVLFDVSTFAHGAEDEAGAVPLDTAAADELFETPGQILALTIAHRFGQLLGATVEAQAVGAGLKFRVALPRSAAAPLGGTTVH